MHIVFVTPELAANNNAAGGLASFTTNMARIFTDYGHHVSVVFASTKEISLYLDENIDLYHSFVPLSIWNFLDKAASLCANCTKKTKSEMRESFIAVYKSIQVRKAIDSINSKRKIDIVHYASYGTLGLFPNKKIPYVLRMSSVLSIWRGANLPIGEYEYEKLPLLVSERLHDYIVKKNRFIISPSKLVADIVKKNLNDNVTVLESPFLIDEMNWDNNVYEKHLKGKKYILYYGYLSYYKGIHVIAQLAETFLKQNPDMYIVMTGKILDVFDTSGNNIRADEFVINKSGIYAERVLYLGRLVREDLYPIIKNSELCLLPSRIENLANACVEAMAMGKIVVATDGASYEQLIVDRVSGFLCERDNPDSFLQGINEALNLSEEEKRIMCMNAKKSVKRLRPESIYQQYFDYYERVIKEW